MLLIFLLIFYFILFSDFVLMTKKIHAFHHSISIVRKKKMSVHDIRTHYITARIITCFSHSFCRLRVIYTSIEFQQLKNQKKEPSVDWNDVCRNVTYFDLGYIFFLIFQIISEQKYGNECNSKITKKKIINSYFFFIAFAASVRHSIYLICVCNLQVLFVCFFIVKAIVK